MRTALIAAAVLVPLVLLLRAFLTTPPAVFARRLRMAGGAALLLAGAALLLLRQFALALPLGFMGLMILRREAAMRTASGPARSNVRSAGLEMRLDHETGEMDGRILAGRHEGRMLSELSRTELLELGEEFRSDPDSLRLLESYLDRAHAGWREDVQADRGEGERTPPRPGGMSAKEAYDVLGLEQGASEAEVREAHRRLMKQVHPDRGGSAALAAQINEAKDRILGQHR